MFPLQRSRYRIHSILIIGICLLLFSAISPHQIEASIVPLVINNTLADFKDGQFQRTSLANALRSSPNDPVTDLTGGVQLGPIGLLKSWKPDGFKLPLYTGTGGGYYRMYGMGATAIGNRIFIIGGFSPTGSTTSQRMAKVWSTAVSTLDGAQIGSSWDPETQLPAAQGYYPGSDPLNPDPLSIPVAEIASPAVTSVSDAAGLNGYIYVIGGNAARGVVGFSSYAVRIATVTNGRIAGWLDQTTTAHIPSLDPANPLVPSRGAQEAMAVTAQIGGKTYVYLIGGFQHYYTSNGNTVTSGLKAVFYARVGTGGKLYKPSTTGDTLANEGWERNLNGATGDIPVPGASPAGLWDASAVADNFVASSQATANAIYVMGGQVTPASVGASYSSTVYRALVNSNGSLDWIGSGWTGLLFSPRSQSNAIAFRGNIYMAGGVANGTTSIVPDGIVLTSYVEDDLTLHQFDTLPQGTDGQGTNFLQSKGTAETGVLPGPRKQHGLVLVRADANSPNSAFLYVLGGIGIDNPGGENESNGAYTVFYGKIGGGEDVSTTGYASDGWYYGQPIDVAKQFSQVEVQEIDWTSVVTRTSSEMDIALDYRLSQSGNCANATWDEWIPLAHSPIDPTHFSVTGPNAITIVDPSAAIARCFQYRAHLTTSDALATPLLLNTSVKVKVPGGPDLNLKSLTPQRGLNNTFLGLSVVIQNVNKFEQKLSADFDKKGSFFVDLCIFGPGVTPVKPTLPLTAQNTQCSKAYANVSRSYLTAGASYTIPQWQDTKTNQVVNLINYFKTPGTYNVIIAIDSFNSVDEGIKGGEGNNVPNAVTFSVTKPAIQLNLPLVRKP